MRHPLQATPSATGRAAHFCGIRRLAGGICDRMPYCSLVGKVFQEHSMPQFLKKLADLILNEINKQRNARVPLHIAKTTGLRLQSKRSFVLRVQCIMRTASGPEPVREPEEIFLVDRVQHLDHRTLDDLVLQRRDAERAAAAIRL